MSSDAQTPETGDPSMTASETRAIAAQIRQQYAEAQTSMLTTNEIVSQMDITEAKTITVLGKMEDVGSVTSRQCQSKRVYKLVK